MVAKSTSHLQPYTNQAYDPFVDKQEEYLRCSVCSFAGIDAMKLTEPEEAVFSIVTTGSVYQPPAGTPVDQLASVIDKTTEARYVQGASCPLCGTARWLDGSAPDLLR